MQTNHVQCGRSHCCGTGLKISQGPIDRVRGVVIGEKVMSKHQEMTEEEERRNNRFSFIIGIFIAMAIIIAFTIFFH